MAVQDFSFRPKPRMISFMSKSASYKDILLAHIQESCLYTDEDTLKLSSTGAVLEWIMDLRPLFLDPENLDLVTDAFWDMHEDKMPFQIAGMEVAAIPLVVALIMKGKARGIESNGIIIRKERKTTGLGKTYEGHFNDHPVVLVDDLINSGYSMDKARAVIDAEGKKIKSVFVVIDYEAYRGIEWRTQNNIDVNSLFKLEEFGLAVNANKATPLKYKYEILWRHYEKGAFPFNTVPKSTPLLVKDRIYMGTESGHMICVDAGSGEKLWDFDAQVSNHNKGIWSSPAHHDGKIYFGAYNGNMFCLNAQDGSLIWKNPSCEFIGSSPLIVPELGLLFIGLEYQRPRMMGSNAAMRLEDGARIWETGQKKYQHGSAAYYAPQELVIFGNADHNITAYEAKTGKPVWVHETERSLKYPCAVDEDLKLVVGTSFDGNIYGVHAETGMRIGAVQTEDICYTTPLITHGKIFAGSGDRRLYIIDANTFEVIETLNCHARVYSSPRLIGGNVVFGTNGGRIIELDPDSLDTVGFAQLPDTIPNAVSASEDGQTLYAATHMNELYAVKRIAL